MDLVAIYRKRFGETGLQKRRHVWQVLCETYFSRLIGPGADILDLGCGYGEFINAIPAKTKIAVDVNPDAANYLSADVRFLKTAATDLDAVGDASVDVVFTSNFLEHLSTKAECTRVFEEVHRVLRPNGRFIAMGPNIRYAFRAYWDAYDHGLPLSDRSLVEGLSQGGFRILQRIPRFLPLTMELKFPTPRRVIKLYLALPLAWKLFGEQFLVVAQKPEGTI